jgi:hypothetical protein
MLRKVIWVIVGLAVGGYLLNSYLEKKAKREEELTEAKRIERTVRSAVDEMVSRTGADASWELHLSKRGNFRFEPILTVDLEKLWLRNRPILFVGAIKDIATSDESRYIVSIERSLFGSFSHMFSTDLQLSLLSSKHQMDSFLEQHQTLFENYGLNNGVAVVARIKAIRTVYVPREEGERDEVKIGEGKLIDILYTGHVLF